MASIKTLIVDPIPIDKLSESDVESGMTTNRHAIMDLQMDQVFILGQREECLMYLK